MNEPARQCYECVVIEVLESVVSCELHDLLNSEYPIEIAEIYLRFFSEDERAKLLEGAVFYWTIKDSGSQFKFPDPVVMTDEILEACRKEAEEMAALFEPSGISG